MMADDIYFDNVAPKALRTKVNINQEKLDLGKIIDNTSETNVTFREEERGIEVTWAVSDLETIRKHPWIK